MNHVERFKAIMDFKPVDRLPYIEWAMWWTKTIDRWKREGLPDSFEGTYHSLRTEKTLEIAEYFGLDPYRQFWISPLIEPTQVNSDGSVSEDAQLLHCQIHNMDDYRSLKPKIFPSYETTIQEMKDWGRKQQEGNAVVWITLEGFFWFPRTLLGIENHMYSFYDQAELMHQMNQDLVNHQLDILRRMEKNCVPTFMTFAEDMSYNHGPMLSKTLFDEFLAPYYHQVIPVLEEMGIIPFVDSDGDVTEMVPWFEEVGIRGVLPLERQAGTDINKLQSQFPNFCFIGHFDKLTMEHGEESMRNEFERLLPAIKRGGFIPSVDHQTPPSVSIEQYKTYIKLLREYSSTANAKSFESG